jgi:hypothetical protein
MMSGSSGAGRNGLNERFQFFAGVQREVSDLGLGLGDRSAPLMRRPTERLCARQGAPLY